MESLLTVLPSFFMQKYNYKEGCLCYPTKP
nr:MAG TPA: hypothetical protein [Caudoviricetes sp.]DAV57116.1 MAG TPA: hypothetical protein [Caudoviricetes sp.]